MGDKNIAPQTTAEQDVLSRSQRRVNLIWESMQAGIAAGVVGIALYVSMRLSLASLLADVSETQAATANTAFMLLSNLASLVIGFYFGRTNHQRTNVSGGGTEMAGR